ncbi:DUF2076 domain-containing protein [Pseudomonas sp. Z4-20]|uniref:DUF2076 domain-containing protein n=1 Tax=Pseudomonas sp. Z4-20 TaxID=2817414 RepID=UPI003DAA3891
MNSEEQTLIDGLFSRLQQAEKDSAPRDAQAEARIKEHLANQPAAGYFMAQAILVQEAAIKRLDEQNKQLAQQVEQLQVELQQARNQTSAPSGGGGFLSSIFGGSSRDSRPATAPASSGSGWREPARPAFNSPAQQGFGAAPGSYGAPQQQAPAAGSFLGGALKTAAGVAGGVMLAQGISSLFHSNQPQEIVEVLKEEPVQPANDTADSADNSWGDDQRVADSDAYGNDPGGFSDADYSDDSSSFGDDDSFV